MKKCCEKLAVYSPLILRLAVGSIFLFAGIAKLKKGVESSIEMAVSMNPSWLPEVVASGYGYILPYLELAVGILLIAGLFTEIVAFVAGLMAITFLIGAGLWREVGMPSWNWLLLASCIHLWANGAGECSVDSSMNSGKKKKK